jgi:hypothetical protein
MLKELNFKHSKAKSKKNTFTARTYDAPCSVRRFAPRPVRVVDKFPHGERFFSTYGKNLSPDGKKSLPVR